MVSVKQHEIKLYTTTIIVDENNHLHDMEQSCPRFFKTSHGKRETFTPYRGCMIVRNTVKFTGCKPERKTVVYLYTGDLEGSPDFFCCPEANVKSIDQAKRYIDRVLAAGHRDV